MRASLLAADVPRRVALFDNCASLGDTVLYWASKEVKFHVADAVDLRLLVVSWHKRNIFDRQVLHELPLPLNDESRSDPTFQEALRRLRRLEGRAASSDAEPTPGATPR
jgi:hypothetical protein